MKHICTRCDQYSQDGHIWCQQIDCPAGNVPTVQTYGEFLGDLKIVRPLRLMRTSVIYEAERPEKVNKPPVRVLLKVAHKGHDFLLKREADLLAALGRQRLPGLPTLLPAYPGSTVAQAPYGRAIFRDDMKVYAVYAGLTGEFLRDYLYENPQPWYRHVGWMMLQLADTLRRLHQAAEVYHFSLNPDSVFVHIHEKTGVPHPYLVDTGLLMPKSNLRQAVEEGYLDSVRRHLHPSYSAPELLRANAAHIGDATEVYGLGLLLYEMLTGHPAYPYRLRSDDDIHTDVQDVRVTPTLPVRDDIPHHGALDQLVRDCLSKTPKQRPATLPEFTERLTPSFGTLRQIPKPPNRLRSLPYVAGAVAIVAAIVAGLGLLISVLTG